MSVKLCFLVLVLSLYFYLENNRTKENQKIITELLQLHQPDVQLISCDRVDFKNG